jgi:hypothetical protein
MLDYASRGWDDVVLITRTSWQGARRSNDSGACGQATSRHIREQVKEMKRISILFAIAIAVVAVSALTAIPAATAAAEETKLLPEPTTSNPLTDTVTQSEGVRLEDTGGLEVKCKKSSGSESWTSANLATGGSLLLTECTSSLTSKCTGEGEPTGLIAVLGEVHFWLGLLMMGKIGSETTELISALVYLSKEVKFECVNAAKTFKAAVVVKAGCIAAQDLSESLEKLVSKVHETLEEWAPTETKGEQAILKVLPAGSTSEISCLLKITVNGSAELLAALSGASSIESYEQSCGALTVELMH